MKEELFDIECNPHKACPFGSSGCRAWRLGLLPARHGPHPRGRRLGVPHRLTGPIPLAGGLPGGGSHSPRRADAAHHDERLRLVLGRLRRLVAGVGDPIVGLGQARARRRRPLELAPFVVRMGCGGPAPETTSLVGARDRGAITGCTSLGAVAVPALRHGGARCIHSGGPPAERCARGCRPRCSGRRTVPTGQRRALQAAGRHQRYRASRGRRRPHRHLERIRDRARRGAQHSRASSRCRVRRRRWFCRRQGGLRRRIGSASFVPRGGPLAGPANGHVRPPGRSRRLRVGINRTRAVCHGAR